MSTTLHCVDLRHRYGDDYALGSPEQGVDLEIERGELFALLGPSGCGKTTTLRIIGGFLSPSAGRVIIEGQDVTRTAPHQRPTNTVFQSYALFPHMSLGGNVGFGLQMEGVGKTDRRRRVAEALELVGLGGMEKRKVTELSGGQAQRAALARAIVKRPAVLLLDEPLGALDLRLRRQMQQELARLKTSTTTTFVHVTHDQEEACAIADRIAIMEAGRVVQVDTPLALYREPRTAYVASFIDAGAVLRGRASRRGDVLDIATEEVRVSGPAPAWLPHTDRVAAVIAPDRVTITAAVGERDPAAADCARGVVERVVFAGSIFEIFVRISEQLEIRSALTVRQVSDVSDTLRPGEAVDVSWQPEDVIFVEDDLPRGADAAPVPPVEELARA